MNRRHQHYLLLTLLGIIGLLAETIGVGMVFAWTQTPTPRDLTSPQLFLGFSLAFIGFIIILRGVAYFAKRIIMVFAHA